VERNDSLYTYAVGNSTNHEGVAWKWRLSNSVLARNYVALESLNTLSFAFDNAKVHGNGVTGLEVFDMV
jgi:hypothetical protein